VKDRTTNSEKDFAAAGRQLAKPAAEPSLKLYGPSRRQLQGICGAGMMDKAQKEVILETYPSPDKARAIADVLLTKPLDLA